MIIKIRRWIVLKLVEKLAGRKKGLQSPARGLAVLVVDDRTKIEILQGSILLEEEVEVVC